jgi:Cysteine-rich secretory protein family
VTPYSIGQPTDEEQLYLEFLNRMRADPTAEGQRLAAVTDPNILAAYGQFKVDLNLLQAEFATNPPVPPLAMNAQLIAAARWHSGDMFTNQYQGHYQQNGTIVMSPGDRIATNGYSANTWGENVFAYAQSVPYGHAGFAVDWGTNNGGMQTPPGHRDNMLTPQFREVGMGIVDGVNGSVGPQIITQDFGTQFGSPSFITGVVYYDLNQNGFYDLGEGIGGVTVNTPSSTYYALTSNSGGYALPVSSNGTYMVTFTAPGLSNNASVTIASLQNRKLDLPLAYTPPTISGPNPASLNVANSYTFTAIPGATAYQWEEALLSPYTTVEGAENGLANVTVSTSPGYSVITNSEHASGTHSFDLVHSQPTAQFLTLKPTLLVSATSQLTFAELLGYAFTNETASAQISTDGGQNWQAVWSKSGNDGNQAVDSAFVNQSVSLAAYSGQSIQVRFVYDYNGGYYFPGGTGVGLFLDNIALSNAKQILTPVTNSVPSGTAFTFTPTTITNYLLEVRPQINSRTLAWGPALQLSVTTAAPAPVLSLSSSPVVSGGQAQIDVTVTNYKAGMVLQLQTANSPAGPWTTDGSATLQTIVANSQFRFTTSTSGAQQLFFRVSGS